MPPLPPSPPSAPDPPFAPAFPIGVISGPATMLPRLARWLESSSNRESVRPREWMDVSPRQPARLKLSGLVGRLPAGALAVSLTEKGASAGRGTPFGVVKSPALGEPAVSSSPPALFLLAAALAAAAAATALTATVPSLTPSASSSSPSPSSLGCHEHVEYRPPPASPSALAWACTSAPERSRLVWVVDVVTLPVDDVEAPPLGPLRPTATAGLSRSWTESHPLI